MVAILHSIFRGVDLDSRRCCLLNGAIFEISKFRPATAFASFLLWFEHLPQFVGWRNALSVKGNHCVVDRFVSLRLRSVGKVPDIQVFVVFPFQVELLSIELILLAVLSYQFQAVLLRGAGLLREIFHRYRPNGEKMDQRDAQCFHAGFSFAVGGWCGGGSEWLWQGRGGSRHAE